MQQETMQEAKASVETIKWVKALSGGEYAASPPGAVVARHGDLYVKKHVGGIPGAAKRVRNGEILRSDVTGHVHGVVGEAALFVAGEQAFVQVTGVGGLGRHAEHGAIKLAPGDYEVARKREYQDDGSVRRVVD